jgi:glutamate-ammonia-ligase adenylyltransferase
VRAEDIAPSHADDARRRVHAALERVGERARDDLVELGALLWCAYPALAPALEAHPEDLAGLGGLGGAGRRRSQQRRDARAYRRLAAAAVGDLSDIAVVRRGLRRFASRERMRIAARELLAHPGQDVDVTARELSDLADVCCETALAEALAWAQQHLGTPCTASGERCPLVVIGMGKLGGRELNAGSDVDLMLFYETDEGSVRSGEQIEGPQSRTLYEYFTRTAQRFVSTLDEATGDGIVWRVDLRLRPEGTRGPLVNALASAERYYETWGRTWERAALVRARPIAGDLAFGARLLEALAPFVWRRAVDPRIVGEMATMLARARAEAGDGAQDDLKLGPGGLREVEFFAQSLQLVWGGRDPRVRGTNTLDALRRLRTHGFVSEREAEELSDAYLMLRRVEHRVQFATGLQVHALPRAPELVERIARSLGYADTGALARELADVRGRVAARFAALGGEPTNEEVSLERLWIALDALDESAVAVAAAERFGAAASTDLPRHLVMLARRPDSPLGATTRDRDPAMTRRLVNALADAADSEQAARLLAAFFARFATPGVYVRAMADDPLRLRALCSLLGASAFLGEALVGHPDLADSVAYARGVPTPEIVRAQLEEEVSALPPDQARDVDAWVGALRRAKRRVTFEIGLADLAGELGTRDAAHALTAFADATLEHACRFAMTERGLDVDRGLALIAMGKLGGRELGYGSDLDLLFVYDPPAGKDDAQEVYARTAQRVLRLVGAPHGEGPGYDLDTRLRPSGSSGLLVVSVDAFARYQAEQAESWERQALVKARACAGDRELGERVIAIAREAAYQRGAPPPERLHHLRTRMERELAHERRTGGSARYDVKFGRGGLVDVEFAAQWLQMKHGADPRVRTTETAVALAALETCGYLDPALADALGEGLRFLRRVEQRLRVSHGTSATLLEAGAPGLVTLARRMGIPGTTRAPAEVALLERYTAVTGEVRAAYLRVLGLEGE